MTDIKVVLFDLGGVLLRLNDPMETFGLRTDESTFLSTWSHSPAVRAFERGAISAGVFAKRIVAEAELSYDDAEFLERFDSWPDRLFRDTIAVLDSISATYRCAMLSNTNVAHWRRDDVAGQLEQRFDRVFLSYETGLLKPDREAFEMIVETYQVAPEEILFFDDNPVNVDAANEFGIEAILCKGIGAAAEILKRRRMLTG